MSSVDTDELAVDAPTARYPWILVGLLWLVAFLNSADRTILIAVMPQIRSQFGLTPTQLALISSTFFWIYAVAAFFSGRLGDRAPRSRVILYGLVFWSVATGVASLATGVAMLIALRGLVALGESTYFPAATALISDWHEPRMRSRTLSLHQTAVFAGAGLGALTAGMIADRFGWRMPYVVYGAAGIALCFVLRRWLRDAPIRGGASAAAREEQWDVSVRGGVSAAAGKEQRDAPVRGGTSAAAREEQRDAAVGGASISRGGQEGNELKTKRDPLGIVLRNPSALFLCVVFFLATGASNGISVWSPTFVHDTLGLNLAESALYGSTTINIAGFLAVPLGGLLADALTTRSCIGRFHALAIGLSIAAICLLPLRLAGSGVTMGLVLLASGTGKGLFDGCIYAAMHDVVPPEARATAVGLMTMLGFFGAGMTPIFVAEAAGRYGMGVGMTSLAVLYVAAVALLLSTRHLTRRAVIQTRAVETGR